MALLVLVLALAASGLAESIEKVHPHKIADPAFLQKQLDLTTLFYHIQEPWHFQVQKTIAETWDIEKNIEHYTNVTAVKLYVELLEEGHLPRGVPFAILNEHHRWEATTLFHVLYSAKDYETFYKTAVHLRDHVNEGLFLYVLSVAIVHRHDTQGVIIPPIYEVFPSYFFNGEIMETSQRINIHGHHWVEHYPSTYLWDNNVVIRWNTTLWPYVSHEHSLGYFTHDVGLNAWYYNRELLYPTWLGGETVPLVHDNRGEWFWFLHKQLLTRYYMERLSNGFGEIPELGLDVVQEGYFSGLVYPSGVPFPVRPSHYHLDQPWLIEGIEKIEDYERRIRDAIEVGYYINEAGEHISLRHPESIDHLGRLIEANIDSPNVHYYKDFISVWKQVLGNSVVHHHHHHHEHQIPLLLPSVLEHYHTALRDPAFWMIWKRVLNLFQLWQEHLPHYKPEELALPTVNIEKVEVDKLVTYFEHSYVNITNHLYMNEHESKAVIDDVSVLVQRPVLNHKPFKARVHVKSEVAKTVVVKFFLAPKYDSHGYEIPLHHNYKNFFLLDVFTHDLPVGESVIKRESTENLFTIEDWTSAHDIHAKAEEALHGKGQFILDQSQKLDGFPHRLLLPKGRVGGMPFVLMVYISEYREPKVPYGTGFDPATSLGLGSGARRLTEGPLGFPLNRPLHLWQIQGVHNLWLQDVLIHHKHTPEIVVPHVE